MLLHVLLPTKCTVTPGLSHRSVASPRDCHAEALPSLDAFTILNISLDTHTHTHRVYMDTVFTLHIDVERGGSVVECRTPEREVGGSKPTAAVLCPWTRHFTPRKYWLITQETVAPSRHDRKIVDWDVKPQHKHIDHDDICTILHVSMTSMWNKVRHRQLAYFLHRPKKKLGMWHINKR